ncbi:hypothetical protein GCM10007872_00040 [Gluconobacter sphaericus NBRC 12467]|uniref:Uncharacterized protein n=1 Tax=Gluconobacter sphaericus NBRC 12467 TaxID=1307951 RepID=A0AA37SE72_9PROT|nr:hypothetical protein AA12467_2126 [Gluconobacter sphaericus NBRC 12467]GEB43402.1 hypothetical protein GSP01_21840 [Gluconobacter sphaericus NBRC 12467]GLQ83096.1 hypothetical protein GCM10007872_00040 [Gluconobacter sphaericus NBRC 12467]
MLKRDTYDHTSEVQYETIRGIIAFSVEYIWNFYINRRAYFMHYRLPRTKIDSNIRNRFKAAFWGAH